MTQCVKIEFKHRVLSVILAVITILSILPLSVFASTPSELTTDIGEKDFVVGVATEFSYTTVANSNANVMVNGASVFSDPDAIEKLEYYEVADGNWYEFKGEFGPASGFPMGDATSRFKVTFKEAGIFSVEAYIKNAETGEILCKDTTEFSVVGKSELKTDISEKTFVTGEMQEFTFTTMANDDAGALVYGGFKFNDMSVVDAYEYYDAEADEWYAFNGVFGPESGFPLTDNMTCKFRVRFNKIGRYNLKAYVKTVDGDRALCYNYSDIIVRERSELSFENESLEIKYTDQSAYNKLINSVEEAELSYKSSNTNVVTVDHSTGILNPVGIGESTITVTRKETATSVSATASYTVTVVPGAQDDLKWMSSIPDTIVWNDPAEHVYTVEGGSGDGSVTYTSSDESIASVDADGKLTLKKSGIVTITATKDGGDNYHDKTATYTVSVIKATLPDISFEKSEIPAITIDDEHGNSFENPVKDALTDVTYSSSDEYLATVDENGKVTIHHAYHDGVNKVTITATAKNDEKYEYSNNTNSYTITLNKGKQTITFENSDPTVIFNDNNNQFVNVAKSDKSFEGISVEYKIDNLDGEAKLLDGGKLDIIKAGTVKVTAIFNGNDNYDPEEATYTLKINKYAQEIAFEHDEYTVINGDLNFKCPIAEVKSEYSSAHKIEYSCEDLNSDKVIESIDSETGEIVFTNNIGTVTIIAKKYGDANYEAAEAKYTLVVEDLEIGNDIVYTIEGEKGTDDWYRGPINIVANEGYSLSYERINGVAEWKDVLENVVAIDGIAEVSFYVRDSQGRTSALKTVELKRDTVSPSVSITDNRENTWKAGLGDKFGKLLTILTFGAWEEDEKEYFYNINLLDEKSDVTSPVNGENVLYFVDYDTTEVITNEEALEEKAAGRWCVYNNFISVSGDKKFVVYAKVTDDAGNYVYATTNGIVFDKSPVTEDNINVEIETQAYNGFYKDDVKLSLDISDNLPSSGLKSIRYTIVKDKSIITGEETLFDFNNENPKYTDLVSSWSSEQSGKYITVSAEDNNSDDVVVRITVTDNAGNTTVKEITLSICTDIPELLQFEYIDDPEMIEEFDGVKYYSSERTAKIVIKHRSSVFNASNIPTVTVNNSKGEQGKSTYKTTEWSATDIRTNGMATYTMYIEFNGSARYDYSVEFTDIFGNNVSRHSKESEGVFAVDKDIPTASITVGTSKWTKLLDAITFGVWSKKDVTVTAEGNDETGEIKPLEIYVTDSEERLSRDELDKVTWRPYEKYTVDSSESFVVYIKVSDYAGHYDYICSDGVIVDKDFSKIKITPEASDFKKYGEDFDVTIEVNENFDDRVFSGIKRVEYWVVSNNVETIREVLYSFEYSRNHGENSNGGKLVVKEMNDEGKLIETVNKAGYEPKKSDLKSTLKKTVTINASENNSDDVRIYVSVTDNAGNTVTSYHTGIEVDTTAPQILVSYDTNECNVVGGRGYFRTNRVAKVVITERTSSFNRDAATESITLTAKNGAEKDIAIDRNAMIVWDKSVTNSKNPDLDTHTAYVYFTTDANYTFKLKYTDEAGNKCKYSDVDYAEGTVAKSSFTVDKQKPSATVAVEGRKWTTLLKAITFGIYKNTAVDVFVEATDDISPYTIEYYKTSDLTPKNEKTLNNVTDWKSFSSLRVSDDERATVYFKITDYAGNVEYVNSDGFIVDKTKSLITLTPEKTEFDHNGIPLYNGDVKVDINVQEMKDKTYSGINKVEYWVKCDGKETARQVLYSFTNKAPEHNQLVYSFSKTVTIKAVENNSCDVVLYVGVTDNAGNYSESRVAVDIDITIPTISVRYNNNDPYKTVSHKGYFPSARTATVVITERAAHFNAEKATAGINISATDLKGNSVIKDCSTLVSAWKTSGTGDTSTHTATIKFAADANYVFALSYSDAAGNINRAIDTADSATPYKFAVDKSVPTGTVSVSGMGKWEKLISVLTFGLWTNDTVTVNGSGEDVTTPIESIVYYKTSDVVAKTAKELDNVSGWKSFSQFEVSADERFVVYLRITDSAGNISYVSTSGIIVDDSLPDVESVKPEITITPDPSDGIYNSDVTVGVSVIDPKAGDTQAYSGLKDIRYEVYNMGEKTQEGVLFRFDITDPLHGELKQNWKKNDAIVVDKTLNNSNDVKIVVYATDNSDNAGKGECSIKIDTTAPEIDVTYNNNRGDSTFADGVYFDADRTAQIVVTERNFDPERVDLTITNTDGYIPNISGWTKVDGVGNGDDTKHMAVVVFDRDGDYTFDISMTDMADNASDAVDYADSIAPTAFTVDKTVPQVNIAYDNNNVLNGNYYNAHRVATVTITEHNFDASRFVASVKVTDYSGEIKIPELGEWTNNGDVHTATISYSEDAVYVFDFEYADKAGNKSADIEEQTFCIDTTAPVLAIEQIVDESANNSEGNIGFVVIATDVNFDVYTPVLTAMVKKDNAFSEEKLEIGEFTDVENGKMFTVTNIADDGIYRINCTVVDKAGNAYTQVVLQDAEGVSYAADRSGDEPLVTFSVNRNGSTYEVDEDTKKLVDRYYVQNVPNDIVIVEINADALKEFAVTLNGKELESGTDYTVTEDGGSGSWMKYTYTVNKELFANEGEYKLVVSSKDAADNDAFSDVKDATVTFVVDRTAPVVTISGVSAGGRYQTDKQEVTLIPADDGGSLRSVVVNLIDDDGKVTKQLLNLEEEALEEVLDNNDGKITFEIGEGLYQNIQIVCTDYSVGDDENTNVYSETLNNISVSPSSFMIFWANTVVRWLTIGGIAAVIVFIVVFIILKSKKRK